MRADNTAAGVASGDLRQRFWPALLRQRRKVAVVAILGTSIWVIATQGLRLYNDPARSAVRAQRAMVRAQRKAYAKIISVQPSERSVVEWGPHTNFSEGCSSRDITAVSPGSHVICTISSSNSKYLGHVAHQAQSLFPCWSLFLQNTDRQRVVLLDGVMLPGNWSAALLDVMGANVVNTTVDLCGTGRGLAQFSSSGEQWVDGPNDANVLRDELVRMKLKGAGPAVAKDEGTLHVGILDRMPRHGRQLVYYESIRGAILKRQRQPGEQRAVVDVVVFDEKTLEQQAEWVIRQDVIISSHGNQLTNVAFVRRCTAVLELFPPNHLVPQFFPSLGLDAGAVYFYLHVWPSVNGRTLGERARNRRAPLYYTAEHIMRVWDDVLVARTKCLAEQQ